MGEWVHFSYKKNFRKIENRSMLLRTSSVKANGTNVSIHS